MSEPLEMWVVYKAPTDFPNGYIARKWLVVPEGPKATLETLSVEGLEPHHLDILRDLLPKGLIPLHRMEEDDPVIVEAWT